MNSKALLVLGTVVVGGSLVVGFENTEAPTLVKAESEAPTKDEINEMIENYPTNTILTEEMSDKMKAYYESIEMNEEPSHHSMRDDPTVTAAAAAYQRVDEALQKKIRFTLPSGSLLHFNTFEKGFYPQDLLDQSVERDVPILRSVQTMSDNVALNRLIDEAIVGMNEAAGNGDAYGYFEAWAKLDAFNDIIGELSRIEAGMNKDIDI